MAAAPESPATEAPHLAPSEREALGKAARADVPRSSHAGWEAPTGRPDPVDVLEEQARTRVAELVPIRYGRMLASPFTFYRGAAAIMASDLAGTPRSGLTVQVCGDAHLSNFGGFASPDRKLVFSVNDFDETLPGPWEWDVKRLAASVEIAARFRGFKRKLRRTLVEATTREYRDGIRSFARMGNLDVWYSRLDADDLMDRARSAGMEQVKNLEQGIAKAERKDSRRAVAKLAGRVDGRLRILSSPPLITAVEDLMPDADAKEIEDRIQALLRTYMESLPEDRRHLLEGYRYVHMARKVVGVGSVGTRAWVMLLEGRDGQDPLFLQAKEAGPSVLEPYLGESRFSNHGQRVVEGQRLMQSASDILLGWCPTTGIDGEQRDFYVRQLWDWKVSAEIEVMVPKGIETYVGACGWTLARAHARSGDRVAIASYLGGGDVFDRAVADFAEAYADQNERDYAALVDAVRTGRVAAADDDNQPLDKEGIGGEHS